MNAETLNTLSDVAGADVARLQAEAARDAAAGSATKASGSASAAEESKTAAATSEANAAKHEEAAKKAADEAGAKAGTDKTLSIENAPADAAAVGDIVLDRTKEPPEPVFYNKAETDAKIKELLDLQREEDLAKIKFWTSNDPTSPASFIGGTWERIEDCTIWGASDTHPAGTVLAAGLPNIEGTFVTRPNSEEVFFGAVISASGALAFAPHKSWADNPIQEKENAKASSDLITFDASRSSSIYGKSTTVQPPAYCLYIWRRIA